MKLQGCLACLLLALCLGSGEAGLLLSGGESSGAGAMETTGHGVGEAIGQEVGEAIKHGVGEATGGGDGEAAGSGVKETMGPGVGDALARGVEEAAHALGNTGSEAGRQAENVIQHGVDAAHSSSQGMPGGNGALGTNGQPPCGGHGSSGSPGNPGGPGIPWDQVYSGGSGGSFGTNSQGGSWGHEGYGGAFNLGTNTQAAVAQPPYGSRRSSDNPNAEGSSNDGRNSGGSISGGSSGGSNSSSGGSSELHWNSQLFPGLFGLDTFWKNLKSKLGFMNWDTISKNQIPDLRTRIFLYFCRLWEKFKQSTPFLNWKAITENYDYNQQKYPTASGGQHSAQIPTKCGVTVSSSASRARPDLLQWVKFW
ncbi:dermokine-like isoform X3 [Sagmatias obliquidens]|uniref:dermokine-like isoform X3 n=1 Tax=Sagmatias obliquidens TaxID=3371155 RepID=UPI000F443667|nr:dermokine-like isoform X3 [Lagenorhynchus obliquidens]